MSKVDLTYKAERKERLNVLSTKARNAGVITPEVFAELNDGHVTYKDKADAEKLINDFLKAHPKASSDAILNAIDLREAVTAEAYFDAPLYEPHKLKIQLSMWKTEMYQWLAGPGVLDRTFGK
jgi:hypothetical protein